MGSVQTLLSKTHQNPSSQHQINLKFVCIVLHVRLNTYTSFKLHCLSQLPLFCPFNAAVVLAAFEELISFIFARLFKF